MYDSKQFNGFVKSELDNLLFADIDNYCVFNESDLHSAVYFYVRTYFSRRRTDNSNNVIVRCEPVLSDKSKPDLVVYHGYTPIYLIEMKMLIKSDNVNPDSPNDKAVVSDLEKLKKTIKTYPSIKWGFMIVVYDSEDMYDWNDAKLRRHGYNNISVIKINLRRMEDTGRRRNGYDEWRAQFDKYLSKHF